MTPRLNPGWLVLFAVLPAPAAGQSLRLAVGGRVIEEPVSTARGYPAYPVTLLGRMGGTVVSAGDTITVALFGDTLRFRPGFAEFRVNGTAAPLTHWSFVRRGDLFLPIRFYTDWLPERYPDRLRFRSGTLTVLATTRVATRSTRTRPPASPTSPVDAERSRDSVLPSAGDGATQSAAPTRAPTPAARPSRDPDALLPGSLRGFIDSRISGVFDSNIDHEADPTASYGTVGRLGVGIQTARSDPFLAVRYDFGFHRFANSERWNRATHDVSGEVAPRLSVFRLRVRGAVRVGSWTEDRELANQLVLRSALEIRPDRNLSILLFGEQRIRRITGTVERADTNRLGGMGVARRWRGGGRVELEGRYEDNHSERPTSRYTGWSGAAMIRIPLTASSRLAFELEHRQRRFAERLVDVNDVEVPRHDRRWTPALGFSHEFAGGYWSLELEYELERNASNEVESTYLAHRVGLGVRRRW